MSLSDDNIKAIQDEYNKLNIPEEILETMPAPGELVHIGFFEVQLPEIIANGFNKAFIFKNGYILSTKDGFKSSELETLYPSGEGRHLLVKMHPVPEYNNSNLGVAHFLYVWDSMKFLDS